MSVITDNVNFATTPVLVLLPSAYPNAVIPGETLEMVLGRINAYRSPTRQIVGAIATDTGRPIPLNTRITSRLVAHEVILNQHLQMGPTQYAAERTARQLQHLKGDGGSPP